MRVLWSFLLKRGDPLTATRTKAFLNEHCSGVRPIEGEHIQGMHYQYNQAMQILWTPDNCGCGNHG